MQFEPECTISPFWHLKSVIWELETALEGWDPRPAQWKIKAFISFPRPWSKWHNLIFHCAELLFELMVQLHFCQLSLKKLSWECTKRLTWSVFKFLALLGWRETSKFFLFSDDHQSWHLATAFVTKKQNSQQSNKTLASQMHHEHWFWVNVRR